MVGHAVRAMYLYCAMSDIADLKPDRGLDRALGKLWAHTTSSLLYVTGGIGSSRHNEGFTFDRDMPNESAYCETCDNGADLDAVVLPESARITVKRQTKLLGGLPTVHAKGRREQPFCGGLYRNAPPAWKPAALTFVPYYAWDNRKPGAMAV